MRLRIGSANLAAIVAGGSGGTIQLTPDVSGLRAWAASRSPEGAHFGRPFAAAPALVAGTDAVDDEILVLNAELMRTPSNIDPVPGVRDIGIGPMAAWRRFEEVVRALEKHDLLSTNEFRPETAIVSEIISGRGAADEPVGIHEWVDAYVFTVTQRVKGVRVFDGTLKVNVNRDGGVCEVALKPWRVTTGTGRGIENRVTREETSERARKELAPGSLRVEILRDELMYILPPGPNQGHAAPRRVVEWSAVFRDGTGEVVSRKQRTSYAIDDPLAKALDHQVVDLGGQGDSRR